MNVLGYADRFSVRAGGQISFMVSCENDAYQAEIIRLDRAFPLEPGAPWNVPVIEAPVNRSYPGVSKPIHAGSFVEVPGEGIRFDAGVSVHCWIWPTLPARGREQGIASRWNGQSGFTLGLTAEGNLFWRVGDGRGAVTLTSDAPFIANRWHEVSATADLASGEIRLRWHELPRGWVGGQTRGIVAGHADFADSDGPLMIGATAPDGDHASGTYNGKVDRLAIWTRALADPEISQLAEGIAASEIKGLIADWDPVLEFQSRRLVDKSSHGRHGTLVNLPARLVTGANWTGRDTNYQTVPAEYGAIHFHDDDLEDCRWAVDFTYDVPADLPGGLYAARLTAGDTFDCVPFYVRPAAGTKAKILYLGSTNTYLAYGNEKLFRGIETDPEMIAKMTSKEIVLTPRDEYLRARPEIAASCYDLHEDGSGTYYSTRLRPVLTMRPDFINWMTGELRHFSGDMYLVEWLEQMGFDYDVATDEDLHVEGLSAIADYKVIITGGHPEYWTTPMMDALEAYLAGGGRMLYLGGNGFYWVTGMDSSFPHVVEVRRGYNGTRSWESPAGEVYQTTSGEPGGLWRYRGRNPNRLTGIGFTAQGWGGAEGYVQRPEARDPRAAWIFDGIGPDEIIGEFGYVMNGASGDEIDRYDLKFGTPPETLRLATSEGRQSDYYQFVLEDCNYMLSGMGGQGEPRVRSDITLLEMPNGGAVFAAGSITWNASLPWNGGDNNVSRVTANVVRRFAE